LLLRAKSRPWFCFFGGAEWGMARMCVCAKGAGWTNKHEPPARLHNTDITQAAASQSAHRSSACCRRARGRRAARWR
jgi:hypothetical protein